MLREMLCDDIRDFHSRLITGDLECDEPDLALVGVASALYQFLAEADPHHPEYVSRLAIARHLNGELREAGKHYRRVLELSPPEPLTDTEAANMLRFAPILKANTNECFDLVDVVAIHHPNQPLIAYHLFWEDDYDFPDDYEPCDHEVIWVAYDADTRMVSRVWCFFHSYVLSTDQAAALANANDGRTTVYVEWGKHGSLLDGWEDAKDAHGRPVVQDMMRNHHQAATLGGRQATHPLKRWWPKRFDGDFADYLNFGKTIDTRGHLLAKSMMGKAKYANAVLQQHFLRYNFHPKYDWPSQVSQVLTP